jgi:hypothetical protein
MQNFFGTDMEDPRTQMILAMAAGLLGTKGNLNQALSAGLMGGSQAYDQAQKMKMSKEQADSQRRLINSQITENEAQAERARSLAERGLDPRLPMPVQEWEYFNKLSPQDQQRFLDMKRQNYGVSTIAQVPTLVRRGPEPETKPLTTLPNVVSAAAQVAAATGGARVAAETLAKSAAQAQIDLPQVASDTSYTIELLDKLKSHPGLILGVGDIVRGSVPPVYGAQADFVILHNQIKGTQFLRAYETLRGGGHITEIEGKKATDAMSRLDRAGTPQEFKAAASELQEILRKGFERARMKTRNNNPQQGAPQARKSASEMTDAELEAELARMRGGK